jgi:TolB protein
MGIRKASLTDVLLIAFGALMLVAAGCSDNPTEPVPAPPVYKIAFVLQQNSNNDDIYSINPDGTELTQLTDSDNNDNHPIWSPDGRYIYYQTRVGSAAEVFRMNADGTNKTNISNSSAWDWLHDISSDGTQMVFTSDRTGRRQLLVMDLTDSSLTQLTNDSHGEYGSAQFTPNGRTVVYSIGSGSNRMYVVNIADTTRTNISENNGSTSNVQVSPDGSRVAYVARRGGTDFTDIWVCGIDGSDHHSVSNSSNYDNYPCWSPNGQKIVYSESIFGAGSRIYTAEAIGTGRVALTESGTYESYPAWSRNGLRIAYISYVNNTWELYVIDTDGTARTVLTDNVFRKSNPVWSPAL